MGKPPLTDEERIKRRIAESESKRSRGKLPYIQAKTKPRDCSPPPRTVHVSELTHAKMSLGNYQKYRCVIDYNAVLEWVGYQWIFIRPAQPEDRKEYPVVVRGHG